MQLPCDYAAYFGKADTMSGRDMLWFWESARGWLANRSVFLYQTTDEPINNIGGLRWLRPTAFHEAPAVPPYAVCLRPDSSSLKTCGYVVRRLESIA